VVASPARAADCAAVRPYWMPPWHGAPTGGLGVTVALDAVIAQSETAVVRIPYVQAYPEGMTLALERLVDPYMEPLPEVSGRGARLTDDDPGGFVFGLRYSDGWEGDPDAARERPANEWPPKDRVLFGGGSGGGLPNRSYWRYWVWPLPPPGPVRVSCRWPAAGIASSVYELDSGPIRDAARRRDVVARRPATATRGLNQRPTRHRSECWIGRAAGLTLACRRCARP
jgi:hypothetical protein